MYVYIERDTDIQGENNKHFYTYITFLHLTCR